jgi:hypothetical protein
MQIVEWRTTRCANREAVNLRRDNWFGLGALRASAGSEPSVIPAVAAGLVARNGEHDPAGGRIQGLKLFFLEGHTVPRWGALKT